MTPVSAPEELVVPRAWARPDVLAASVCMNLLALALPIAILQVYDRILPNAAYETLAVFVSALIVVALIDGAIGYARNFILARCGARFEYRTDMAAIRAALRADLACFESVPHGAQLERFQSIQALREFYHGPAMMLVVELPFVVLFLALIWRFSGTMVLIPLAMIGVFLAISMFFGNQLRAAIETKGDHHERRQNFIIECLRGMHTVKALAMEQQMLRRYERLQGNSADSVCELARINSIVNGLATTFSQAIMVCFVSIGSINVVNGTLSVGALAAGTMLAGRVLQPTLRALSFWTFRQSIADKEAKVRALLALPREHAGAATMSGTLAGHITLREVSFRYGEDMPWILQGVDLDIQPGESVSLEGANGAGKSTLINLIMGFVTPQQGEILIDGADIGTYEPNALREQIALIPQDGVLFHGSLLENMTLFREGEYVSDAVALARKLGLDDTILKLPEGLDTLATGDLSQAIPNGFAQRLVMVRALAGRPRVIIFDDANPGFDDRNDRYLQDLLGELKRDHTLIVVSHRPSLQRICERHYRLADGRLSTTDAVPARPIASARECAA
ncbi:MAG: ATP-binding cassette domain-containing protein [Rhodobiaceae bacterium]|nr:ATP-binding cassette domain-containing protein [Gammaproteobacteria bacterium]MCC0042730.1 ATP-binding cassette domain-containing protein [Rhodobiaceae bacterium]